MSCNGNVYNIGMGCCEPVLGPVENYYTKPTIDRKLEEISSAITSGCCITPEEVDEKIEEAISGITVSGVTEQQLNDAITSAKTEIEAEIPSLDGYATEQWVLDKHYITGVDLSNYATLQDIPTVPTKVSAFENDVPYLTEHQSLSGYATTAFVSAYTYDKSTIDEKVAQGGSFDPSQYYNKTATDELLAEKLDASAYTPTDLSNYYNKQEVNDIVTSAITDVEAEIPSLSGYATEQWVLDKHYITSVDLSDYALKSEIPTVPTSNTAFTNDAGYITSSALNGYATTGDVQTATNDMATQTWVNNQGFLTEHQSLSAYSTTQEMDTAISQATSGKQDTLTAGNGIDITNNVISATGGSGGTTYTAGRGIDITSDVISFALPISGGSGNNSIIEGYSGNTASAGYTHAEGFSTQASGSFSHAEGSISTAKGAYSHAEGSNTTASGESSHSEGKSTTAKAKYSHSEGNATNANGESSHAEGWNTTANGSYSHAEGCYTTADGYSSHADGYFTESKNKYEHACGSLNVSSKASTTFGDSGNTLFSVGNSIDASNRHNAFEIRQNGDIYISSGGTDIKLQDHLGGGGTSYTAGVGIDITNDVISVTGKADSSAVTEVSDALTAHTANTTVHITAAERTAWNAKSDVWCGTLSQWSQISGNTQPNTIYLVY